jgi:hypothetical protein
MQIAKRSPYQLVKNSNQVIIATLLEFIKLDFLKFYTDLQINPLSGMEDQLCLWQYSGGLPGLLRRSSLANHLINSGYLNNYNKL